MKNRASSDCSMTRESPARLVRKNGSQRTCGGRDETAAVRIARVDRKRRRRISVNYGGALVLALLASLQCAISFAPERGLFPGFGRDARNRGPDSRRPAARRPWSNNGKGFGDDSPRRRRRRGNDNSTIAVPREEYEESRRPNSREIEMEQRMVQLEQLVASQTFEIKRLKDEVRDLNKATEAFARVVELLRQAGLQSDTQTDDSSDKSGGKEEDPPLESKEKTVVTESFDDVEIFGKAPSSVIEAADVAGASVLAAILGGKQRLLVDVRDAELSTTPETLVQFIELAVLPVAAGLEGLKSKRNRLKIVFPTLSQLSQYRRTMTLAAPDVVALSTLAIDPVDQRDNLVVIVAPSPDDAEGHEAMNNLLEPKDPNAARVEQPVVVLNHHMVPMSGPAASYDVAYHLRLLSVQYMTGDGIPDDLQQNLDSALFNTTSASDQGRDAAVEAAMKHAHEVGSHHGVTGAMVIRAYPRPWHVFVDTSPDTDADFEVAATFDQAPSQEQVHQAIVDCLQGSEEEDELVAQQMQQAVENGQLNRMSDIFGSMDISAFNGEEDFEEDEDDDWDMFNEDSV